MRPLDRARAGTVRARAGLGARRRVCARPALPALDEHLVLEREDERVGFKLHSLRRRAALAGRRVGAEELSVLDELDPAHLLQYRVDLADVSGSPEGPA